MQSDMHYYATYVLARAAGIPQRDSETIAYAAQFVDNSTETSSEAHEDGGLLHVTATAHHHKQVVLNNAVDPEEQRKVWVPFHFLPGGIGETLEEKLLCVKDSEISRQMVEHHIAQALGGASFGLELLGVAAHVYMDTFSHYSFSGIASEYNKIDPGSFELFDVKKPEMKQYVENKFQAFLDKYAGRSVAVFFIEAVTSALGHGGVATYPDRPFLHWRVSFANDRPGNGRVSDRDNPQTYLDGCEKMFGYFSTFAKGMYADPVGRDFNDIKPAIDQILRFEGKKAERCDAWKQAIRHKTIFDSTPNEADIAYSPERWEVEKAGFHSLKSSGSGIQNSSYKFHQAAAIHRTYVLKELLPAHNIAVF